MDERKPSMNFKDIIEIVDGTPLNLEVDINVTIRGGIGACANGRDANFPSRI
jgi:hypothetical protein